jgi:peptidyl-tRNA hydrolase
VGIGRPQSRDPDTVAQYVLSHFPPRERETIMTQVFPVIPEIIKGLLDKNH